MLQTKFAVLQQGPGLGDHGHFTDLKKIPKVTKQSTDCGARIVDFLKKDQY